MTTPSVHQRRLGNELRRLRERAGMTGRQVEAEIEYSRSMLSRVETGSRLIRELDLVGLLDLYGVTDPAERDRVLKLCQATKRRDWFVEYKDIFSESFRDYLALEPEASSISMHEPQFIPGLLQTEAYARAMILTVPNSAETVDRRTAVRMERQQVLWREDPPDYEVIIDESAFHRPVGGRAVLRDQLHHVAAMAQRPNITVRILTYENVVFAGGPFTVLRMPTPGNYEAVFLENIGADRFLDEADDVRAYGVLFDKLRRAALDPDASVERIVMVAEETT